MAEKKIGLKKPQQEQPFVTPPSVQVSGVRGQMPLPVGVPIRATKLTPRERRDLEAVGWKEGDPIPSNMGEIMETVRREAISTVEPQNLPPPGPLDTPVAVVPEDKRLEDLPEDQRRMFAEVFQSVKAEEQTQERLEAAEVAGAGPGVNQAIHTASGDGSRLELDDDRATRNSPASPESQDMPDTGALAAPVMCAQCGFPCSVHDVVNVTDEDKRRFIESILGGRPFQKEYPLLNGQVVIRLRTLTPKELDVAWEQVNIEQKRGEHVEIPDRFEQMNRYRESLQLVKVVTGENVMTFPESFEEWTETGEPTEGNTLLPQIKDMVWDTVMTSESFRRMLTNVAIHFNRLTVRMEANAYNSDFWKGIDSVT